MSKEQFLEKCELLAQSDPFVSSLEIDSSFRLNHHHERRLARQAFQSNHLHELSTSVHTLDPELLNLLIQCVSTTTTTCCPPSSLRNLILRGLSQDAHHLLHAAATNPGLESVTLQRTRIQSLSCLESLCSSNSIRQLYLMNIIVDNFSHAAVQAALSKGLRQNTSLQTLEWVSEWRSLGCELLVQGLHSHVHLKHLSLRTRLTDASCVALNQLLLENAVLVSLNVGWQDILSIQNVSTIFAGLQANLSLLKLYLSGMVDSSTQDNASSYAWYQGLAHNRALQELELSLPGALTLEYSNALANGLCINNGLERLLLNDSLRAPIDSHRWKTMLETNRSLHYFNVHCEYPVGHPFTDNVVEGLAQGMSNNTSLQHLCLQRISLSSHGVKALAQGLVSNKQLRVLNMSENQLSGTDTAKALAELIGQTSSCLQTLILDNNNITHDFMSILIHQGLSQNASLNHLSLNGNHNLEMGAKHLLQFLSKGILALEILSMENCMIDFDEFAKELEEMLIYNSTVVSLDIGGNGMGEASVESLAQGLTQNTTLRHLGIHNQVPSYHPLAAIGRAMQVNMTLKSLKLGSIFRSPLAEFFELAAGMNGLEVLDMTHSKITEPTAQILANSLGRNPHLRQVQLQKTDMSTVSVATKRSIDYQLALNRHGRYFLYPSKGSSIPMGLWPSVLANMTTAPKDAHLLFYFLQRKPDLIPNL